MGSHRNFKNIGNGQPPEGSGGGGGRPTGNSPLARQPSIYSLTFDEFQNSLGGFGKDFGSMNMDEFLKNVWTAEESQAMASAFGGTEGGFAGGNLQRQGSLTLPRTLSQKTVDEVWRELYKEGSGCKDGSGNGGSNLQQRQPTLGEITLEEFLLRAGVVREETQSAKGPNNNSGFYGELSHSIDNTGLALGYPQLGQNNGIGVNRNTESNNQFHNQSPNFAMNVNGVRSSQQQQQPQLFLNQSTMAYASQLQLANNTQLANPGMRDEMVGIGDPTMNNGFFQGGAVQGGGTGMMDLGAGGVTVASESPANQLSSDGLRRRNEDTSSLSPVPFVFSRGVGGKKGTGAVEKVVERRQRRMIKNRESAARSRARKQAYTMELEAEVAKLKEENRKLQKKQVEFMEMQKNQDFETGNPQKGTKRRCLRRTQTGPW